MGQKRVSPSNQSVRMCDRMSIQKLNLGHLTFLLFFILVNAVNAADLNNVIIVSIDAKTFSGWYSLNVVR